MPRPLRLLPIATLIVAGCFVCQVPAGAQCPEHPEVLRTIDTPGAVWGLAVSGNYLYVADWDRGLLVFDIVRPHEPVEVGHLEKMGRGWRLAVRDGIAYVAAGGAGLHLVDVSDPTAPALLATADTPDEAHGVALGGDYAFVADHQSGVQVVNVSDPMNPTVVGSVDTPEVARDIAVKGNFAYVAGDGTGLIVVDISAPEFPVLVTSLDLPDGSWAVAVGQQFAYVAEADAGLQIVNIANPLAPTPVGAVDTPGIAVGLAVAGECAFVADYDAGLQIIDISDPHEPKLISNVHPGDRTRRVVVPSDFAYVGNQTEGLLVVDLPGFTGAGRLCPEGTNVYATDGEAGVPVVLFGQAEPLREIGFDLKFDPDFVRFEAVEVGSTLARFDRFEATLLPSGNVVRVFAETEPSVQAAVFDTLVTFRFDLVPGAEGESPVATTRIVGIDASDCQVSIDITACASDGDVNEDGVLTPVDAFCAFQCALGRGEIPQSCRVGTDCEARVADADCNGVCTAGDALWIFERYFCNDTPARCGGQADACPETPAPTVEVTGLRLPIEPVAGPAQVEVPVEVRGSGTLRSFGLELETVDDLPVLGFERGMATESWAGHGFGGVDSTGLRARIAGFDRDGIALDPGEWISLGRLVVSVPAGTVGPVGFTLREATDDLAGVSLDPVSVDAPAGVSGLAFGTRARPNPFRSGVTIDFNLPAAAPARVSIHDVAGRRVADLVHGPRSAGAHRVEWSGRNDAGNPVAAGLYFYRVESGEHRATRKIVKLP